MSKELIYTDEWNVVLNKHCEEVTKSYQCKNIDAKLTKERMRLEILDILEFEWQMFDDCMSELFGYSDIWIVETSKYSVTNDSIINSYPYFFDSWEQLKSHMLDFANYNWKAVYDVDGELLFEVRTTSVMFRHRIRRLNASGQHRKIAKDLQANIKEVEKIDFQKMLWDYYSILAYYLRFEIGEDISFTKTDGTEVTMEVRQHD